MHNQKETRHIKAAALSVWVIPSMVLMFLLNAASDKSFVVFVMVIFGCNMIYDVSKSILKSAINKRIWKGFIIKQSIASILFFLSFAGIYIEALNKLLYLWGVVLIWLPLYVMSLWCFAESEKSLKAGLKVSNESN